MTRRLARVGALVVTVGLAAGCSSVVSGTGTTAATPTPTVTPARSAAPTATPDRSAAPTATPAALGATLERIALQGADLAAGFTLRLQDDGDQVRDQVTLDNCGFAFTTEAHRIARRQYYMAQGTEATGLVNELVAYDSPAQASKAVAEWHRAAATCPHTLIHSSVADEPDMLVTITQDQVDVHTLPSADNVVTAESLTASGQGKFYNFSVLQAHGRYLDCIYYTLDQPVTAADHDAVLQLATITGRRLTAQS